MHTTKRRIFFSIAGLLLQALCFAAPAFANSNWGIEFSFDNPGGRPSVATMRSYILGCVPAGSVVNAPLPGGPQGPFSLRTPAIGGHELTDSNVYNYLNGCNLKPASVTGIAVMGDD
jgi:hypothetical protein